MENILLKKRQEKRILGKVNLSASKSESNRLLLINSLAENPLEIKNLSDARDTQTMDSLLKELPAVWDVKDAGTTMRFLTAYLALHGDGHIITGTDRMKQRPIGPLVNALSSIGATISYEENDGFPPLKITKLGEQLTDQLKMPGNISSQYISALLMIAPCLPQGLSIEFTTEVFSKPYIDLTLSLMESFGVVHEWSENKISVKPQVYSPSTHEHFVESDWSGASYWYGLLAINPLGGDIELPYLKKESAQGDSVIASIMEAFGIVTAFEENQIRISKKTQAQKQLLKLNFRSCPDLAQTVMVAAAVNGIELQMTGLESLKIKETDRVAAMQNELKKIGANLTESDNTWILTPSNSLSGQVTIETYEDHRMAMAFAPLSALMDINIKEPEVVNKSYPGFWKELDKL